ncbi:MAG TPA: sulfur oxidation c-type cytochrome SoxA [Lautropia sp.]|nr:sulfur oxidation c-type cytochrome SoxA [Lautropia sp.]
MRALALGLIASVLYLGVLNLGAQTDSRKSSYFNMSRENQRMQDDLSLNPASFWIIEGQGLWQNGGLSGSRTCSDCHGDVAKSMHGVAATFPKHRGGSLRTLQGQINHCRVSYQGLQAFDYESKPLLALLSLVASQSRGMPINVSDDAQVSSHIERGKRLYNTRIGHLNLSCAQCHDDRAGQRLGGVLIPQGHPTGYPIYRIEWQTIGSLQRRLRNCMAGVRAERHAFGSEALNDLETYLMHRANGMLLESPGVRP